MPSRAPHGLDLAEIVRFGLVGLCATAVHFLVLLFAVERLAIPASPANGLAFVSAVSVTYAGQSLWVFRDRSRQGTGQIARFALSLAIGVVANMAIMALAVHVLGLGYRAGFAIGVVVVPLLSFFVNKLWVFQGDPT